MLKRTPRNLVFWLVVFFIGSLIFVFPSVGFGPLSFEDQQKTLEGIKAIQVVVKIGLSREGPTRQTLQEEVEKWLIEGGVPVVQEISQDNLTSTPSLYVEVAVWKNGDEPLTYFVSGNFYQSALLENKNSFWAQVATWQASLIGQGDIDRIREDVARIAKSFASQYQFVNQ